MVDLKTLIEKFEKKLFFEYAEDDINWLAKQSGYPKGWVYTSLGKGSEWRKNKGHAPILKVDSGRKEVHVDADIFGGFGVRKLRWSELQYNKKKYKGKVVYNHQN